MPDEGSEKDKFTKTYAALGIGLICVVFGVPLWWKTTEIYRVQLPYSDIDRLSQTEIRYAVDVKVVSFDGKLADTLPDITKGLQEALAHERNAGVQAAYRVQAVGASEKHWKLLNESKTLEGLDAQFWLPGTLQNSQYPVLLLPQSSPLASKLPFLGSHGNLIITNNQPDVSSMVHQIEVLLRDVLVREGAVEKSLDAAQGLRTQKPDKDSMRWFRSQPGYDVTFTLINPQPDLVDVQWNIQGGIHAYFDPLLNKLANFTSVSVTSQVLHYVGLVISPTRKGNDSYYTEQDLPHLINPLESKLGSHASNNADLNFVVYVPTRDSSPLYIQDENGEKVKSNAFLSPRWGGILIYNVDVGKDAPLPAPVDVNMKTVMEVFITQLRLLLNIHVQIPNKLLTVPQLTKEAITDWELSAWLRCRCVENLATAKASLQSLSQLLGEIGNIVINDEIGQEVEDAVSSIMLSQDLLTSSLLYDAYEASHKAIVASEKAFFDPSLLELLYFPEDQKFAIYIPLFLPISIPVITSVVAALKFLRQYYSKPKELKKD